MYKTVWTNIVVFSDQPDRFPPVKSTKEAALCLLDKWPPQHGLSYRRAILACTGALKGETSHDAAEAAFVVAAMEANLKIERHDWFEEELVSISLAMLANDPGNRQAL